MHPHIERILWSDDQISRRVSELAAEISDDLSGCSPVPMVVGVATGAFVFLADLVRKLEFTAPIDFVRAESYGSGTESNGAPTISFDVKFDIKGRHVLLVEDIVDTGLTLSKVIAHLESKKASSVSVCTFLDKTSRREVNFQLVGEGKFYRGFECPDYFVVGYGMDFDHLYRNLPYIGVLKPELYKLLELHMQYESNKPLQETRTLYLIGFGTKSAQNTIRMCRGSPLPIVDFGNKFVPLCRVF